MPPKTKAATTKKKKVKKTQVAVAPSEEKPPKAAAQSTAQAETPRDAEPASGRVTVKYNIYDNEYATAGGVLTMEALDDELAISFGFPGAFVARLRAVDGDAVV